MNMRIFAESLTLAEVNELSNILWEIKRKFAIANARPITPEMKRLVSIGEYINAIKEYRTFYNASLMEAKIVVDSYKEGK